MNLDDILQILRNRLVYLEAQKNAAVGIGDLVQVDLLSRQIAEAQTTLAKLETLL